MDTRYLIGLLVALVAAAASMQQVAAQGTKSISSSVRQQQQQQFIPQQPQVSTQLSSTFLQMFNQLTPSQQRQFINQMSSVNRRSFQQQLQVQQPQTSSLFSSGEFASSGQSLPSAVGTKSASFRRASTSQQQVSPVQLAQQQNFLRSQEESFSSQPQVSRSFQSARELSINQVQQPTQVRDEFESSRLVRQQQGSVKGTGNLQSAFKQRVQSFSSQPISNSFSQQFSSSSSQQQQDQAQPPLTAFSRFQESQISSSNKQPVSPQQFTGLSSSSSLAAGNSLSTGDVSGFSAALQQEKIDSASQQGFDAGSTSGFESSDVQQRNLQQVSEDFSGLTAASIDNRWYVMRPVENPSALGLGDAESSSGVKQVPLNQAQAANALLDLSSSTSSTSSSAAKAPKKQVQGSKSQQRKATTTNKSENDERKQRVATAARVDAKQDDNN